MNDLQPGSVVPMDSFTATYGDRRKGKGDWSALSYRKLGDGRQYIFLLLGAGGPEAPMNANKALNALGWRFMPDEGAEVELSPTPVEAGDAR